MIPNKSTSRIKCDPLFSNDEIKEEDVFWRNPVCHLALRPVKVRGWGNVSY
jgi:hypothetical protein